MFGGIGGLEIIIVLVIGIVVFGVIKMPQIARILGSGMSGYKKLKNGFHLEDIVKKLQGDDEQNQERKTTTGDQYDQRPQQPPRTDQYGYRTGPWQQGWQNPGPQNSGFGNQGGGWQQPPPQYPPGQQMYPPPQQPPNQSHPPDTGSEETDPPDQKRG